MVSLSTICTGGGGPCTVTVTLDEVVLPLKLVLPPYVAVMLWLPDASDEVLKVAVATPFRSTVPRVVVPSEKVTVPVGTVGVDEPGATTVTVAIRVTVWPRLEGLGDATNVVVVVAGPTV